MNDDLPDLTTSISPVGVKASVPPWRRIAPYVVGGLVGALVIGCLMAVRFLLLVQRGISEVMQMGPWPASEVPARELITVDLSDLGLRAGPVQNARSDELWGDGGYTYGVLVTYSTNNRTVATIWAMKYPDGSAAANDFGIVQQWVAKPGNCRLSTYAYLGNSGVLHCQYAHAYEKLFWNSSWIVAIEALEGTSNSPDVLIDLVRDALAAHWKAMSNAAS